ncbi:MAG: patatin-like phospholipase family protein [Nitritalea sp.]
MQKIVILSIDGGGIRGIIAARILAHLETLIRLETGNTTLRLMEFVDFVAGTSTGGILGLGGLLPDGQNAEQFRYDFSDLLALYREHGGRIFSRSLAQRVASGFRLRRSKYRPEALEELLLDYFGDTLLSELKRPCLVPAYALAERSAYFFTRDKARRARSANFRTVDVARATTAAPTYFPTALVRSQSGSAHGFIDGGVFANNPAMCAYAEVRKMRFGENSRPSGRDMFLLSIGTGTSKAPIDPERSVHFGLVQWVEPLIDVMMSGNAETVEHQMHQLFSAAENRSHYLRLNPLFDRRFVNPAMDAAQTENREALMHLAERYIEANAEILTALARQLLRLQAAKKEKPLDS